MKIINVVAAVIIKRNNDNQLVVFSTQRGYGEMKGGWEFPGGKIEEGETPQEALRREIKEELATEIEVGEKLDTIEYDYEKFHLSMQCFLCKVISGELELLEHEAAKWLTKEKLFSVEWLPADIQLVKKIGEKVMNSFKFDVPYSKKIRVIIDTDAACEADDPFAIVHALLSQKLMVKGIVAEQFNEPGSMEKSYQQIQTICKKMHNDVPIYYGEETAMNSQLTQESEGVDFIIQEAMKENERPLYVLCIGAITNLAKAFQKCPEIINRMTVIWIGTFGEETQVTSREYNAGNDIQAANLVLQSGTDLWIVPQSVYSMVNCGLAELQEKVYSCGEIGEHLFSNMIQYNMSERACWTQGESWSLGDSPAVAIALNPECGKYKYIHAPKVNEDTSSSYEEKNPMVRLYTSIDSRYVLEDFFAKLKLNH